jgi:diamine N-acetyltransferase
VGYSKIILNNSIDLVQENNICKLERLYILKEYYDLKLGKNLFEFIIKFSRNEEQIGIWLFVWVINERAIKFYTKNGFKIIGSHDFKISSNHSNPNHLMFLRF